MGFGNFLIYSLLRSGFDPTGCVGGLNFEDLLLMKISQS